MYKKKKLILVTLIGVMLLASCSTRKDLQVNHDKEVVNDVADGQQSETESGKTWEEDAAKTPQEKLEEQVYENLSNMTLEEKIAQMFMITPEALTGYETVTAAGDITRSSIESYPVGGLIYFSSNLVSREQVKEMLENTKSYYSNGGDAVPFLAIDEEGGTVARIGNNPEFHVEQIDTMSSIGSSGDSSKAKEAGEKIGRYLSELGFNMDMAPDADVLSNPANTVIGSRSFGSDANLVSEMVLAESEALSKQGIIPVIKHFPGHGATEADSHQGYAYTNKTLHELLECELIPFSESIAHGIEIIMVGHISVPNITGDNLPSSLSDYMITNVLRGKLGFEGLVITDAMNMGAITEDYDSATAAVMAIQAGVDMILTPESFQNAYTGVMDSVRAGEISEARIDESVKRILRVKLSAFYNEK